MYFILRARISLSRGSQWVKGDTQGGGASSLRIQRRLAGQPGSEGQSATLPCVPSTFLAHSPTYSQGQQPDTKNYSQGRPALTQQDKPSQGTQSHQMRESPRS